MPLSLVPTTNESNTSNLFPSIRLAVQVVLGVSCLIENSIAIFILCKNFGNGGKTFTRYVLINMACSDILRAFLYNPAYFVIFSHDYFLWLVQGQAGDVLCKIYGFLFEIPDKVLALCLVALACDVTRNLSSKGRREHTRRFSAILMIFFWITAAASSCMYIVISNVKFETCLTDPAKQHIMELIYRYVFVVPAISILTVLNLVIFFRVKRRKKEITRKREIRRAGKIKERQQKKWIVYVKDAEGLTEEDFVVEASQQTSRYPFKTVVPCTESKTLNNVDVNSDADGDEEDADQSAQESFDMTQEEAKIEFVTAFLFVVLSIILQSLPKICEDSSRCSKYVFFLIYSVLDVYGVIKPGIYAYVDKDFRKRYKQLSPFACCCFRRTQCHTAPQQVETRGNLSHNETSL